MRNTVNEVYIFGTEETGLTCLAIIDEFINVQWVENYFTADTFTITLPFKTITDIKQADYQKYKNMYEALDSMYTIKVIKDKKVPLYSPRFIMTDFSKRVGVIESYKINENDSEIEISGRGFLTVFDGRDTEKQTYLPTPNIDDHVGIIACKIINKSMYDGDPIKSFFVADENQNQVGISISLETEEKKSVYKTITEILNIENAGFSTLYNPNDNKIYFYVIDASKRNIKVAVSRDDGNLISNEYEFDMGNYKNFCLVRGENGIEAERYRTKEGIRYGTIIDSTKKQDKLTEDAYRSILSTEGEIELNKSTVEEHFNIEITENLAIDLGDTCVVKLFVGYKEIAKEIQVTHIEHNFTKNEYNRKVGFGKPYNARQELQKALGV